MELVGYNIYDRRGRMIAYVGKERKPNLDLHRLRGDSFRPVYVEVQDG